MESTVTKRELINLIKAKTAEREKNLQYLAQDILRYLKDSIEETDSGELYGYRYIGYRIKSIFFDEDGYPTATFTEGTPITMNNIPDDYSPYCKLEMEPKAPLLGDCTKVHVDYLVSLLSSYDIPCYYTVHYASAGIILLLDTCSYDDGKE